MTASARLRSRIKVIPTVNFAPKSLSRPRRSYSPGARLNDAPRNAGNVAPPRALSGWTAPHPLSTEFAIVRIANRLEPGSK
jgi:hypothetical protein